MKKILVLLTIIFAVVISLNACHSHYPEGYEVTVPPTCTEPGEKIALCSCGEEMFTSGIDPTGNKADDNGYWSVCNEIMLEYSTNYNGYTYISGCDPNLSGTVVIPATTPDGTPITFIGTDAFKDCTKITEVVISDGIEEIGYTSFYGCSSLTSVIIPDSVTKIENGAFCDCESLKSFTIPDSVTSIGGAVLQGCTSIESITIPYVSRNDDYYYDDTYGYNFSQIGLLFGTENYEENADFVPSSLKNIVITGGKYIPSFAFYGCSGINCSLLGIGEPFRAIFENSHLFFPTKRPAFFVILPSILPPSGHPDGKLYKIEEIFKKPLTGKGCCDIIGSPLRRAFLLCPKLAPQDGHGLPEREVHGSFTSVRLQIIFMGGADIMANEVRVKVTLVCTECKQRNYDTMKNKKNNPDRLELKKHCKFCRKHTLHKESK